MAKQKDHLEAREIAAVIRSRIREVLVVLFVPSHTKKGKPINNQEWWAHEALGLLGRLYRGGTSFLAHAGVYFDEESKKLLWDKPIVIESYASVADVQDESKLNTLVGFLKRMGQETNQAAVAVVIDNAFHEIKDF